MTLAVCERRRVARTWWRRLTAYRREIDEAYDILSALTLGPVCHRLTRELAYGQQRLLEIALALATRPKVLLLDEPAAGVPREESKELFAAIAGLSRDITVLFIEHDMELVFRFASRVIVMVGGSVLVEGTPAEIASDERVRAVYLGKTVGRNLQSRAMAEPLLALADIRAGYGSAVVLDGVSFELPERGGLAVLGRNGVGKSTLLLTIMGYTQVGRGRILWRGEDITRRAAAPPRPRRHRLGGAGARDFFHPDGGGKPHRRRARRALEFAGRVRSVSPARRAPAQSRQSALRRRAADAGDRARADDQSGAVVARRAARRPRPHRRRGTRRRDPPHDRAKAPTPSSWSSNMSRSRCR